MLSNIQPYPPGLRACLEIRLRVGALVIQRKGLIQVNHDGKTILTAVDMHDYWRVDNQGTIHALHKGS